MKKVLIITYYWPPAGGPGVQRWLKFAKYLPQFGFEPIILTVNPDMATYPVRDESLMAETKNMKVYTTSTSELFSIYKKASGRKEVPYSGFANERDKPGPRQKLSKFIRGNFFIPDPRKGWNNMAYRKAVELLAKYDITNVATTSPPHSTQLIGLKLKKNFEIHWLADLRDPWTDIYYYNQFYPTRLAKNYDRLYERAVFEKADIVTTVSPAFKKLFVGKSKRIDPVKIKIIPNGFDEEDFDKEPDLQLKKDVFTIAYTGTITTDYSIFVLLEVLTNIADKHSDKNIRLRFIGKRDQFTEKLLDSYQEKINIERVGSVSHAEAICEMKSSDALLLGIPDIKNNQGILPGKIFEYLAAKKPIIGIGPAGGDAGEILQKTSSGKMIDYNDSEKMNDFITAILKDSLSLDYKGNFYSRKNLTRQLIDYFK